MSINRANVEIGKFFEKASNPKLSGYLKSFPTDFIVEELTTTNHICYYDKISIETPIAVVRQSKHADSHKSEKTATQSCEFDVEYFFSDKIESISILHSAAKQFLYGELSNSISVSTLDIDLPPDRVGRRDIYRYLNFEFPLLKANVTNHPNEKERQVIQLSMDTSLNELLALGIPARELDDLYTYVKHGRPESGQADKGVHIGYSIDKQARAEVYRLICKAYRGIESKTVPVKGGGELKCMHLRWKSSQQAKRVSNETTQNSFSRKSDIHVNEACNKWHVWCQVLKFNREQMDAARLISNALGVGVNAVNFAGIKDKRSMSCQMCSISIDSNDPMVLKALGLSPMSHIKEVSENTCMEETDTQREVLFLSQVRNRLSALANTSLVDFAQTFPRGADGSLPVYTTSLTVTNGIIVGNIVFRQDNPIRAGDLWGNQFTIRLRDIKYDQEHTSTLTNSFQSHEGNCQEKECLQEKLRDRLATLQQRGVPNFFGSQRMGAVYISPASTVSNRRSVPMGPVIGLYLLTGKYAAAVFSILLGKDTGNKGLENYLYGLYGHHSSDATNRKDHNLVDIDQLEDSIVEIGDVLESVDTDDVEETGGHMMSEARNLIEAGRPLKEVYRCIPVKQVRERSLLKSLARYQPILRPDEIETETNRREISPELKRRWEETCRIALCALPFTAKNLWINSYQSWVWNRMAAFRLGLSTETFSSEKDASFSCLQAGDVYSVKADDSHDASASQRIAASTVRYALDSEGDDDTNSLLGALLLLPLFGKSVTKYPENLTGRFYWSCLVDDGLIAPAGGHGAVSEAEAEERHCKRPRLIMSKDNAPQPVNRSEFDVDLSHNDVEVGCESKSGWSKLISTSLEAVLERVQRDLGVTVKGAYRPLLVTPIDCHVILEEVSGNNSTANDAAGDSLSCRKYDACLQFRLPAGSFATAMLRELLANDDII